MTYSRMIRRLFLLSVLSGMVMGQSAWNTGDLSFTFQQFPQAPSTYAVSGDLLSTQIPHQGAGGFAISSGDTNLVTLVAYDLYTTDTDTLADIFVVFLQDSLPITTGQYLVNPVPGALRIFVWLKEVEAQDLLALLDANFSLDSLDALNASISAAGELQINTMNPFVLDLSFSGTLINANFQIVSISNGQFQVMNSLPVAAYDQGIMNYAVGVESGQITGELNPIIESEGVGGLLVQRADTLNYNFISYQELPSGGYDVFGVMLQGETGHFPQAGAESQFSISLSPGVLPSATPYMLRNVSLDEILLLFQSGELPDQDQLDALYLPMVGGTVIFSETSNGTAEIDMSSILMANALGDAVALTMSWQVESATTLVLGEEPSHPTQQLILGNAYPNPFNSRTHIPVELQVDGGVQVRILDLRGREQHVFQLGDLTAGVQILPLDLKETRMGSGVYFYTILVNDHQMGSGAFTYLK